MNAGAGLRNSIFTSPRLGLFCDSGESRNIIPGLRPVLGTMRARARTTGRGTVYEYLASCEYTTTSGFGRMAVSSRGVRLHIIAPKTCSWFILNFPRTL
eukprot:3575030-Prymnesium_polylepis.1